MQVMTTAEAARLFDVHPSTVKRWCNDGELETEQTPGGHRRIAISAAASFARERGIPNLLTPFHPFEPHVWNALRSATGRGDYFELHALALQWARRGDFDRLERLYIEVGRSGRLPFCDFVDLAVRGLLATVGAEWQAGRMRVGDEHMVTQAILGALAFLRRDWVEPTNGHERATRPVAIVGTVAGNHHHVGSQCVRMLLERLGWTVYYPGPDVPIDDFGIIQMSREASLVCISLPPGGSAGDVVRTLTVLSGFYDRARPYSLAFGGSLPDEGLADGLTSGPFEAAQFFHSCGDFRVAVEEGFGGAVTR